MLLKANTARAGVSCRQARSAFAPVRSVRAPLTVRAQKQDAAETQAFEAGKIAALSAVASSWMFSGQAQAAVELANVAASDNRLGTLSLLFLPALGWVAFNIAQPAFNQLNRMDELKTEAAGSSAGRKKRGLAGAVGMGAALSMFAAQQADAATEVAQLAGDNRIGVLSLLFIPALGWVAFNILQPALNQLNRMSEIKDDAKSSSSSGRKKRGLAGAVGMGAALSMFAAQQAEAATEVAQLAGDNRLGTLSLLFLPALGWVAFNIAQPFFNQVNRMNEIKAEATGASSGGRKKRGLAGAVGMGAALSMFAAQQADAATEVAQLAGDNRLGTLSLLFIPALGWVAFNIAQPFFNQVNRMNEIKAEATGSSGKKGRR